MPLNNAVPSPSDPSALDFPRDRLLTLREVARVLGCSYFAARELVATQALPAIRLAGRTIRINPADLDVFVRTRGLPYAPIPRRHIARHQRDRERRASGGGSAS